VLAEKLRHHTTYQPLRRFLFLDYHFSPWNLTIFSLLRSTYFSLPSFLAGGPILHRNTHTRDTSETWRTPVRPLRKKRTALRREL
jgi:hypothetical protein